MISFREWLLLQQNRDSAIGDLAKDLACDMRMDIYNKSPLPRPSYSGLDTRLALRAASHGATKALKDAWREYKEKVC